MQKFRFLFLSLAIVVFLILAFKKPYGSSSLIGNFDPFPDSLHYVVPARNFVAGAGFILGRADGELKIQVPPLYSWSLIPVYFFNNDVRGFYFANVILGILSIFLLYKISYKLSKSVWVTGLLLFLYVTSFVIYWQPSLAMAENILLLMCFLALWFSLQPLSNKNIILASIFAVACYGSKYVSLPVTAVSVLFILWRVYREKKETKKIQRILLVLFSAFLSFLVFNGSQFFIYIGKFFQKSLASNPQLELETAWLSLKYFGQSFPKYFQALMGLPIYNLWYVKPILPVGLAALVIIWSLYAVWQLPKKRDLALLILGLIAGQLAFLSVILMIEGRYAFIFIPIVFTGAAAMFGWLVESCQQKFGEKKIEVMQTIGVVLIAGAFSLMNFKDLKTQLLVNFKGGETPWWQVGVMAGDQFMAKQIEAENSPKIIISSLSPFVWDFYRQNDYLVLPFSATQSMIKDPIWGIGFDQNNLFSFYQEQLKLGKKIYLDTVGFGRADWPILEAYKAAGFDLQLKQEDCMGACKIYEVTNAGHYAL